MEKDVMQIYIPSDLKDWLRSYANEHDLAMSTVIKMLLERERERTDGMGGRPLYREVVLVH